MLLSLLLEVFFRLLSVPKWAFMLLLVTLSLLTPKELSAEHLAHTADPAEVESLASFQAKIGKFELEFPSMFFHCRIGIQSTYSHGCPIHDARKMLTGMTRDEGWKRGIIFGESSSPWAVASVQYLVELHALHKWGGMCAAGC